MQLLHGQKGWGVRGERVEVRKAPPVNDVRKYHSPTDQRT